MASFNFATEFARLDGNAGAVRFSISHTCKARSSEKHREEAELSPDKR